MVGSYFEMLVYADLYRVVPVRNSRAILAAPAGGGVEPLIIARPLAPLFLCERNNNNTLTSETGPLVSMGLVFVTLVGATLCVFVVL